MAATKVVSIISAMITDITNPKLSDHGDDMICDQSTRSTKDVSSYEQTIRKLDEIDRICSDVIHKMELGLIDFMIAIPGTLFGVIGCPILAIWYYNKYNSWLYPFSCFIVVAINHTLKYIFYRKRPLTSNCGKKLVPLKKMHHDPAMPSGDTAQAGVAAATMIYHGYCYHWALLVPASAFARVYFGSHYIGDTVVGGALGFIVTWAINAYFG